MNFHIAALILLMISCSSATGPARLPARHAENPAAELYEKIPETEQSDIQEIRGIIWDDMAKRFNLERQDPVNRSEHAKAHACLDARLEVNDSIGEDFRKGVFKVPGKTYQAYVRFSNGSGKIERDPMPQSRGMAIKLLGVEGDAIVGEGTGEQDFLMHNHPAFLAANVNDVVKWMRINKDMTSGGVVKFISSLESSKRWQYLSEFKIAYEIGNNRPDNPLSVHYFSGLPYMLGDSPIKFRTRPCDPEKNLEAILKVGGDYLGDIMDKQMNKKKMGACFVFSVQPYLDDERTPIENARVTWPEDETAFVDVATLYIDAPQDFRSTSAKAKCEKTTFGPWNGIVDHWPVGGLNRLRRAAYETSQKARDYMKN